MFFKRKKTTAENDTNISYDTNKDIVYGVNHKDAFAALSELDERFNKGCFSYTNPAWPFHNGQIKINETRVLTYYCRPGDEIRVLRYEDEGLNFKDEILTALKKLVREHKIFVDNKEKQTTEGIKNSLNDYISD
jgi:hypothetical protein